jgi:hypothetical protein
MHKPLRGDYAAHAGALLDQLATALGDLPAPASDQRPNMQGPKLGTVVESATLPPGPPDCPTTTAVRLGRDR